MNETIELIKNKEINFLKELDNSGGKVHRSIQD